MNERALPARGRQSRAGEMEIDMRSLRGCVHGRAVVMAIGVGVGAAAETPAQVPTDDPLAIAGAEKVLPFFEAMKTRRVSIDCVGDSNGHGVGNSGPQLGYIGAFGEALERLGLAWYGPMATPPGGGSQTSWRAKRAGGSDGAVSELPASHAAYLLAETPGLPLYVSSSTALPVRVGVETGAVQANIVREEWKRGGDAYRFIGQFGVFAGQSGSFELRARLAFDDSIEFLGVSQEFDSTGASNGFAQREFTVETTEPFNAIRGAHLRIEGPHIAYWMGVANESIQRGFTLGSYWASGGAGVVSVGSQFQDSWGSLMQKASAQPEALGLYLKQLVAAQGSHKMLLLNVMIGGNDRTVDPNVWESALREALLSYDAIWNAMLAEQGCTGDLYVLLWPGPQTRLVDGEYMTELRKRARVVAAERARTAVIDFDRMGATPEWIMSQQGWTIPGDPAHLMNAGYRGLTLLAMSALLGRADLADCGGDLTGDGFVTAADLSRLLVSWGGPGVESEADVTGDGYVNGADLSRVLADWGACF